MQKKEHPSSLKTLSRTNEKAVIGSDQTSDKMSTQSEAELLMLIEDGEVTMASYIFCLWREAVRSRDHDSKKFFLKQNGPMK